MLRYLSNLGLFLLLQGIIGVWFIRGYDVDNNHFFAAARDKHTLLHRQLEPRVILLGGSNVVFGVDSPTLQRATGLNPVNMALTAPLGMGFMLNDIEPELRSGDLVILSFEYEHFLRDLTSWQDIMLMLEQRPEAFMRLEFKQQKLVLDRGLSYISRIARCRIDSIRGRTATSAPQFLERKALNQYGDFVAHHGLPSPGELRNMGPMPDFNPAFARNKIECVNAFVRRCVRRGIRVAYAFPPLEENEFAANSQQIHQIASLFEQHLEAEILTEPKTSVFPATEFFDGVYHLKVTAKGTHTNTLAARISDRFKSRAPLLSVLHPSGN
jgi:hypothetical protein